MHPMEDREIVISGGLSEGESPSRHELLTMVRQHSKFLREGMIDEDDDSDVQMDAQFWHEMLDLYFIRGRESQGRQEDDLVFFVRDRNLHGYGFNDNVEAVSPFFVRRWAAQLEKVAGENSVEVDWRRTFYLNLIAHTAFTVTVAICSIQDLQRHQNGAATSLSPVYKVVKTVYASPSRVNFHVDFKKETETVAAYPNICFAIDDFDDTFDAVVLSETDHCYCVLLNAHGGAAFPTERTSNECGFSRSSADDSHTGKSKTPKLTLFSGFVSYPMVREAYEAGKSGFGSLLSIGHFHAKTDRLYMRGPGGRGEVEVAVSGVSGKPASKVVMLHSRADHRKMLSIHGFIQKGKIICIGLHQGKSCWCMNISWDHIVHVTCNLSSQKVDDADPLYMSYPSKRKISKVISPHDLFFYLALFGGSVPFLNSQHDPTSNL